ncbi:RluA family pseudouridine synthase [Wolbachia endosymbiont of Atemnus politus]|uniref:RluA family pseudouridine synthase n=1 Tax=Wolbachia endosymbiont of Atemnus politus TaxID=2682840 RepID=UPI001C553138|nr:RluA family pseudouridine synthase [Wolbachia endosymbiont of Atemnus politus]
MRGVVVIDHLEVTLNINSDEKKLRLDTYIAEKCNMSRSKAQRLIQNEQVKLLGTPIINNDHIVKSGEEYIVHLVQPDIFTSIESNYDIKLDIIYEDENIIVLSKQSGLTVHPGAGTNNDTLLNAVIAHLGKIPYTHVRLGIVHRLDKDTSGLMVIAKNEEAHGFLSELLSNRKIKREYLAVVWGTLLTQQGTIKTYIAPKRGNKEMMCVTKTTGKLAITHYSVQKVVGQASLVKCTLETGRTHQIRVHMSHIGHSIVGDQVYGKNSSKSAKHAKNSDFIRTFNRQALHAYKLGLYHPKSNEYVEFKSDLPKDIRTLIGEFEALTVAVNASQ